MVIDVNADTRSTWQVQPLLSEAALLHFQLRPASGARHDCGCGTSVCRCRDQVNRASFRHALHRFETEARAYSGHSGFRIRQNTGEDAGEFRGSWFLVADKPVWPLRSELPAIPFDALHSHFLVLADCEISFSDGSRLTGTAAGQTYLVLVEGREVLLAFAAGTLHGSAGKTLPLRGSFALNGTLNQTTGFAGSLTCRIQDIDGVVLKDREVSEMRLIADPDSDAAYLATVSATESCRPAQVKQDQPGTISLSAQAGLKAVLYRSAAHGSGGLRAGTELGPSLGSAEMEAKLANSAGCLDTAADATGRSAFHLGNATVQGIGTSGVAFPLHFPGRRIVVAGLCTAGPLEAATAQNDEVRGIVVSHSALSFSPPAVSQVNVVRFLDPRQTLRGEVPDALAPGPAASAPITQFVPMVAKLNEYAPMHRQWRESFRKCAGPIAEAVSGRYNEVVHLGEFEGNPIDRSFLQHQFEAPVAPFNYEVFERYGGAARGDFRFYSQNSLAQTGGNTLYSVWNHATYMWGTRRVKFITGSFERYFSPADVPDFSSRRVDPIVNSYREDVGVVSYINVHQGINQERTSFAYKLPGPHEVMWIVKDLALEGKPADPRVFMTSHEWKDRQGDQTRYLMVGMFWEIDFDHCTIRRQGDMLWRALYIEEQSGIPR